MRARNTAIGFAIVLVICLLGLFVTFTSSTAEAQDKDVPRAIPAGEPKPASPVIPSPPTRSVLPQPLAPDPLGTPLAPAPQLSAPTIQEPAPQPQTIDQLLEQLSDVRVKRAELDKAEKELVALIRSRLKEQQDKLQKLGVHEQPPPSPVKDRPFEATKDRPSEAPRRK
jgi:hypothetical protein